MFNRTPPPSVHAVEQAPQSSARDTFEQNAPPGANDAATPSSGADLAIASEGHPIGKGPSQLQLNWRKGRQPTDVEKLTQNPHSELNLYRMKGDPPVVEMSPAEMLAMLQTLRQDMTENWKTVTNRLGLSGLFSVRGMKEALRTFEMKKTWNLRLEKTIRVLNDFSRADMSRGSCLAYMAGNAMVGALLLTPGMPPYVADLLTHPGGEKAASVLMEEAVNLSDAWGSGGRIALIADNEQAYEVYKHMGFVRATVNRQGPRNYMILDPATSDKWHQDLEGKWRIRRFGDDERERYNEKEYLG